MGSLVGVLAYFKNHDYLPCGQLQPISTDIVPHCSMTAAYVLVAVGLIRLAIGERERRKDDDGRGGAKTAIV